MRVESWKNTGVESDDDSDDTKPFRSEGQIPLRPPAQLFEGLIRAKQEAAKVEAKASEPGVEVPEPTRRSEAFRVPLGSEAPPVVASPEADDDDEDDDDSKAKKDAPAPAVNGTAPASSWKTEPLPSIEEVEVPSLDFEDTTFNQSPEPTGAEAPPPAADFEPPVDVYDEPIPRSRSGGTNNGGTPPPFGTAPERGSFDEEPEPAPQTFAAATPPPVQPTWASTPNVAPSTSSAQFEQATKAAVNQAEYYAEKRGLRRGLIAGFITGYALKAFLANRKMKRFQSDTKKQFAKQNETISRSRGEQYRLQEQVTQAKETNQRLQRLQEFAAANQPSATRLERPTAVDTPRPGAETPPAKPSGEALPPIQEVTEETHVVDFNGQEVTLQPGQRLERKGWYSVVVDEHGREVQNVIPRGEAFKREQKEKLPSDAVADGSAPSSAGVFTGQTDVPSLTTTPMIASGQVDAQHELPTGPPPRIDWSRRLPAPKNPIIAAVKSPWLWAAIAVILIAYFTAALV